MIEPSAYETDLSWIPEKFRADPPQLARSYSELEGKLTQTTQLLREQEGQLEALFATQDEQLVEPRQQSRGRQLRIMQGLAEEAAARGAREVVKAVSTGRVPAPEDPAVLSRITSELMPQRDPRWGETSPDVLAEIINERPELVGDLSDMNAVVSGLSTAAELARGRQAERTMQTWTRAEAMKEMKRNAQTLSGAAGRGEPADADEEFFERLKSAHSLSWSNRRHS
ncbi:MAG TPA: hypothetical protein DEV93_18565 [Chloroflexi bacterium]|nr:hypothetical protein [Chloroflexota bacterium]